MLGFLLRNKYLTRGDVGELFCRQVLLIVEMARRYIHLRLEEENSGADYRVDLYANSLFLADQMHRYQADRAAKARPRL